MLKKPALLLLASLAVMTTSGCKPQPAQNEAADVPGVPTKGVDRSHKGEAMPSAELFNADEEKTTLSEAKGRAVLVNLWASWCAPCVKELPTLDALSRRPGAPRVIAVSEDVGERPSIEAFLDSHGIKGLEAWRDPKMALTGAIGVEVMPTTVYYDAAGKEVWRYIGDLDWSSDEAARLLAEAGNPAAN